MKPEKGGADKWEGINQPMKKFVSGAFDFVTPSQLGPFKRLLLLPEAIGTDSVGGGGVKALTHEILKRHPFAVVINAAAPGTNPHEFFQVDQAAKHPAGGTADQKPDRQDEQHFDGGPAKHEGEGVIGENQHRELKQLIEKTEHNNTQKPDVLIQHYLRQLRIHFHMSIDDSRNGT